MPYRVINYYAEGRALEWCMSVGMTIAAVLGIIWPETLESSGFITAESPVQIAWIVLIIGWLRCSALMLNGQTIAGTRIGPWIRAIGGVLSAIIWAQFTLALIQISIIRGYPSLGIPFWFMFTVGELYTAYTTVKNG